ncbi:hypothetical protein R6Q59_033274 [Mikania micrantha]
MGYMLIQDQGENEIIRLFYAIFTVSFFSPTNCHPENHSPWSSSGSYHSSPRAALYASVVGFSECSSQSVDLSDATVTYPNTGADWNAYGEAQHR